MGKDRLQEDKEGHEEAKEVAGEINLAPGLLAVPEFEKVFRCVVAAEIVEEIVDLITWRHQPSGTKEERASVTDLVRFDDVHLCPVCLDRPCERDVRDDTEEQGEPRIPGKFESVLACPYKVRVCDGIG